MPKLPVLSGKQLVSILERFGWEVARQHSSHIIMTKEGKIVTLSVPNHKEIAIGTLRSIIRLTGLTTNEFISKVK